MATTNEIRTVFLDYFRKNNHEIVASSPLIPQNDPTLLFTNAGMVQFKDYFIGTEQPSYATAATSQKCLRAGGKHNDLERVGYTARHHTFFEMLGNFSFGDYFKEQAINHAWHLITKEYGINPDKLLVTVYAEDDESHAIWQKLTGFPDHKIIRIATSDNFWSMGETGPCGPCTEIFYDHGEHIAGGPPGSPDEDGDRFIEIWNLVFMQYEQQADGNRVNLPMPSIDTGMGLERITALLQGKHNNYEIDLFRTLIEASSELTNTTAEGEALFSHRVIADHLRATCFLIADGVLPSNEGRGYVLRRIMRRAMRHVHLLGYKESLLYQLVPTLIELMGGAFGELQRAEALTTEILKLEEERFNTTLDRGLGLLDDALRKLDDDQELPGDVAFKLYDTYGFPLDLTQDILKKGNRKVDIVGFDQAMAKQKADARKAWSGSGDTKTEQLWYDLKDTFGATEFLGYENEEAEGQVIALLKDNKIVDYLESNDKGAILTNQTPFYAESGGQEGDHGIIKSSNGAIFKVTATHKKLGALHVHTGFVENGKFGCDEVVKLSVDTDRRAALRRNHSVTHLLHQTLRDVLGDHVTQKGSLVASEKLRFDFSHTKALTNDQIMRIEYQVNQQVLANSVVETHLLTPDAAIAKGAMALFGEKYGDEVRVVSMGNKNQDDKSFSMEFCGGTHVKRTGDIGLFKITSESAVAAGIRRIEAITGLASLELIKRQTSLIEQASSLIKTTPKNFLERLQKLADDKKQLERELKTAKQQKATNDNPSDIIDIDGIKYLGQVLENIAPRDLKPMVDSYKQKIGSGVVALVSVNEGQASIVVGVTKDLINRISAVDCVRIGGAILGGKGGGGRPDMAQSGGPDDTKAQDAIHEIEVIIKQKLQNL
jgi:alanyl-tRNA synthetase